MLTLAYDLVHFLLPLVAFNLLYIGNIYIKVLTLIVTFSLTFITLLFSGANFLAISVLIIYVGAIAILFLLSIMMIRTPTAEITSSTKIAVLTYPAFFILFDITSSLNTHLQTSNISPGNMNGDYVYALNDIWIFTDLLYTRHGSLFIVSGLLLVLAIVGVITLTVPKKTI